LRSQFGKVCGHACHFAEGWIELEAGPGNVAGLVVTGEAFHLLF
jgi:hypothetical protein